MVYTDSSDISLSELQKNLNPESPQFCLLSMNEILTEHLYLCVGVVGTA